MPIDLVVNTDNQIHTTDRSQSNKLDRQLKCRHLTFLPSHPLQNNLRTVSSKMQVNFHPRFATVKLISGKLVIFRWTCLQFYHYLTKGVKWKSMKVYFHRIVHNNNLFVDRLDFKKNYMWSSDQLACRTETTMMFLEKVLCCTQRKLIWSKNSILKQD